MWPVAGHGQTVAQERGPRINSVNTCGSQPMTIIQKGSRVCVCVCVCACVCVRARTRARALRTRLTSQLLCPPQDSHSTIIQLSTETPVVTHHVCSAAWRVAEFRQPLRCSVALYARLCGWSWLSLCPSRASATPPADRPQFAAAVEMVVDCSAGHRAERLLVLRRRSRGQTTC